MVEHQKLQSTQVTSDLAEHDPLMHDRLGGGSVMLRGQHQTASGLVAVLDRVHVRGVTQLQSCCVSSLGSLITHRKIQHTNNWS